MSHNSHPLLQKCVNACPLPFPSSICNIIYTYSGLKECMILCQVFPNSCKCTVIQLLWKLSLCHIRWRFSDNSARTCQNIDAKTLLSRFLPLMRNKLTDDVRTRLCEKCRIWAKPPYSDLPRNSDVITWCNKKRGPTGNWTRDLSQCSGLPWGCRNFPEGSIIRLYYWAAALNTQVQLRY